MLYLLVLFSIRILMFLREKFGELCKWLISLLGVVMIIFGFMRRVVFCVLIFNLFV